MILRPREDDLAKDFFNIVLPAVGGSIIKSLRISRECLVCQPDNELSGIGVVEQLTIGLSRQSTSRVHTTVEQQLETDRLPN